MCSFTLSIWLTFFCITIQIPYWFFQVRNSNFSHLVFWSRKSCILFASVFVRYFDFVKYFGGSRLNKKWNDKASVPYLLHGKHLKAEHRKSVRVCRPLRYMSEHAAAVYQMFVVFAFALFIYSFIYLFSGERDYLWIMEQSPFSP